MLFTSQRVVFTLLAYLEAFLEVKASRSRQQRSAMPGNWGSLPGKRVTVDGRRLFWGKRYPVTAPTKRGSTSTTSGTTTTRHPHRLQPDQWAQYFIFNHMIPHELYHDNPTTPRQQQGRLYTLGTTLHIVFDFLDITVKPRTTSSRGIHYYEPYWTNGTWIMKKIIPESRDDEQYHGKYWNQRVDWSTVKPAPLGSTYPMRSFCFPICTSLYRDWGPICAVRLDTGQYKWKYFYRNFTDMCELEFVNCAYRAWLMEFKLIHRGHCPESYKEPGYSNQWYYFPDAWTPEDNKLYSLADGIGFAMNVNKYASTWFTGSAWPIWRNLKKNDWFYPFFWPWNFFSDWNVPWQMKKAQKK